MLLLFPSLIYIWVRMTVAISTKMLLSIYRSCYLAYELVSLFFSTYRHVICFLQPSSFVLAVIRRI